ncbi:hypothetical protein SDC9_149075 [bioreactor metagenome]|uniref:Uncharacterized protein n=1 Tax=bioreactor metagenome TaxID=1076179 RepID=A0A645EMV0_9ZZZZ
MAAELRAAAPVVWIKEEIGVIAIGAVGGDAIPDIENPQAVQLLRAIRGRASGHVQVSGNPRIAGECLSHSRVEVHVQKDQGAAGLQVMLKYRAGNNGDGGTGINGPDLFHAAPALMVVVAFFPGDIAVFLQFLQTAARCVGGAAAEVRHLLQAYSTDVSLIFTAVEEASQGTGGRGQRNIEK